MATTNIKAVITAEDRASKVVSEFGSGVDRAGKQTQNFSDRIKGSFIQVAAMSAAAAIGFQKITGAINETVEAANRQQAAFIGLSSIAKAFGQDADKATKAARTLAKDGLMTVGDAAAGLKNLLAAGFNLDQAVTLMNRFKDSAAFGRQNALSFGEAIRGATEGIKNGNSILVDNAGVTKNLSVILEEAGYSAQDLMKATTDAGVRQALFNGILKETSPMLGDAGRLSDTFAGAQSRLAVSIENTKAKIGESLQPALAKILQVLQPIIEAIGKWVENNPKLAAAIVLSAAAFLGLAAAIGAVAAAFIAVDVATGGLAFVIMAAIAAIIAAVVLLILNLDKVKGVVISVANTFVGAWNTVKGAALDAYNYMRNLRWGDIVVSVGRGMGNAVIGLVEGAINNAISGIPGVGKLRLPRFASGVENFSGGLAVVGERGPELVNLPRGSDVIPNHKIGAGQTTINVSINAGAFVGSSSDARKFSMMVVENLRDIAGSKSMTVQELIG